MNRAAMKTAEALARISHTPGEWFVVQSGDSTFEVRAPDDSGDLFCGGIVIADRLSEPDARLIAAAPKLLHACRVALDAFIRKVGVRPLLTSDLNVLDLLGDGLNSALV